MIRQGQSTLLLKNARKNNRIADLGAGRVMQIVGHKDEVTIADQAVPNLVMVKSDVRVLAGRTTAMIRAKGMIAVLSATIIARKVLVRAMVDAGLSLVRRDHVMASVHAVDLDLAILVTDIRDRAVGRDLGLNITMRDVVRNSDIVVRMANLVLTVFMIGVASMIGAWDRVLRDILGLKDIVVSALAVEDMDLANSIAFYREKEATRLTGLQWVNVTEIMDRSLAAHRDAIRLDRLNRIVGLRQSECSRNWTRTKTA